MTYIPIIPLESAGQALRRAYERLGDGEADDILRIHSLNPLSMTHHVQLYAHLMRGPSPLSRVQREMIAVTVSAENDCFY
jgi:alkylhydroperoxidase family enzyme